MHATNQESQDEVTVHYKTRLVAKGHAEREGFDYNKVFSPIVKHYSIRILLALVAQYDLELDQLDVRTTFLHGDLDEEIFMTQASEIQSSRKRKFGLQVKEVAI